jgi:chloramphenicol-sensitive protein RarD
VSSVRSEKSLGLIFGLSAYIFWGLFPLFWPLLKPATPYEIVAHRALWTFIFCMLVLAFSKKLRAIFARLRDLKILLGLTLTSILISINWIVYIWATNNGHVVEASLGYYINPLVMIAFGVILLKEKMRRGQWIAVAIATVGVAVLTIDYGRLPWVALGLAFSWGSYGVVKKVLDLGALEGLTIETMISLLPYVTFLLILQNSGDAQFGKDLGLTLLLISAGIVTAVPLLLFNGSTTRLPYTVIGLLQYITPTIQFAIGVWINHEAMSTARWIGFLIIWCALVTLAFDLLRSSRAVDNRITQEI